MSPEQVRAKELDARTDLFSFGVVLYQMATGTLPFQGESPGVIFGAILTATPTPIVALSPNLPSRLQDIIDKALEKDRELRYNTAAELRTDLKRLERDCIPERVQPAGVNDTDPVVVGPVHHRAPSVATMQIARMSFRLLAASAVLAVLGLAAYHFLPHSNAPITHAKIAQISQWNKPMNSARLSPDGHSLAFTSAAAGIDQVFLMLTSGGAPLQLTNDEGDKFVESFSSDGTEVYYGKSGARDEIWAVRTLGGTPRHVVIAAHVLPAPDGTSLYYVKSGSSAIFRADNSGLREELLFQSQDSGLYFYPLLVYPGGKDLLVGVGRPHSPNDRMLRINLSSHEAADLGEIPGGGHCLGRIRKFHTSQPYGKRADQYLEVRLARPHSLTDYFRNRD